LNFDQLSFNDNTIIASNCLWRRHKPDWLSTGLAIEPQMLLPLLLC